MRMKKNKRLATFTEDEDTFWANAFENYMNNSNSEYEADEKAWQDTVKQVPRLKNYDGAKP
jgi:hypothetical protein